MSVQEIRKKEDRLRLELEKISQQRLELELCEDEAYGASFNNVLLDELRQNSALLNLLAPTHERTTCSDDNHCNVMRHEAIDCVRCALLAWMDDPLAMPESFRVEFRINLLHRE